MSGFGSLFYSWQWVQNTLKIGRITFWHISLKVSLPSNKPTGSWNNYHSKIEFKLGSYFASKNHYYFSIHILIGKDSSICIQNHQTLCLSSPQSLIPQWRWKEWLFYLLLLFFLSGMRAWSEKVHDYQDLINQEFSHFAYLIIADPFLLPFLSPQEKQFIKNNHCPLCARYSSNHLGSRYK